jgi:hypothetical protein
VEVVYYDLLQKLYFGGNQKFNMLTRTDVAFYWVKFQKSSQKPPD